MQLVTHQAANHNIYFTKDYNRFKSIIGNRLLNEGKINKIIEEIKQGFDMLRYCPIIVDNELNVIDGQHRLYIARKLKCNIYYVIVTDSKITLHHIAKLNTNTERWKNKDFMHCFIAQGNNHYELLNAYVKQHNFDITTSINLLTGQINATGSTGVKLKFESGNFEVTHEKLAQEIAYQVTKFKCFHLYHSRAFIVAIAMLLKQQKCDIDDLVSRVEKNIDMLTPQANPKQYLKVLEEIYNKHRHTRIIIYQ